LLSSWLGKVWASRILERERAELNRSVETTKAELIRSIEHEKAALTAFLEEHRSELQELSSQRLDALNRKRDVYSRLATKMRILLRANLDPKRQEEEKWAFLAAYDEGYIWASEAVVAAVRDLIATVERKSAADRKLALTPVNAPAYTAITAEAQALDARAGSVYQACLLQMRRDCGFPESDAEYRVVSFA